MNDPPSQNPVASSGALLLALHDGLARFLEDAAAALDAADPARASEPLGKARAVLDALTQALDHQSAPELCRNLAAVFEFATSRLLDAGAEGRAQPVREAQRVLAPLREALHVAVPEAIAGSG